MYPFTRNVFYLLRPNIASVVIAMLVMALLCCIILPDFRRYHEVKPSILEGYDILLDVKVLANRYNLTSGKFPVSAEELLSTSCETDQEKASLISLREYLLSANNQLRIWPNQNDARNACPDRLIPIAYTVRPNSLGYCQVLCIDGYIYPMSVQDIEDRIVLLDIIVNER